MNAQTVIPRNIVLVLGNGFDLELLLKTSYKDFYCSEYCPRSYPAPLIAHLNNRWPDGGKGVRWYDLENELLEYYNSIPNPKKPVDIVSEEERHFICSFEPNDWIAGKYNAHDNLVISLIEKGIIQGINGGLREVTIPYQEEYKKTVAERDFEAFCRIKEGLCSYLSNMDHTILPSPTVAFNVFHCLAEAKKRGDNISIFNFNYTYHEFFEFELEQGTVSNIHGSYLDKSIILGTRDDREMISSYSFLQKAMDLNYNPSKIVSALKTADIVILFGHSLGRNDQPYFAPFFKDLVNFEKFVEKTIFIVTRDDKSEHQIKQSLQELTDNHLANLYCMHEIRVIKTQIPSPTNNNTNNFYRMIELLAPDFYYQMIGYNPEHYMGA